MTYQDKKDQLNVIFSVIGTPPKEAIMRLSADVQRYLLSLPHRHPADFSARWPAAPAEALDLLRRMLAFDPTERIRVEDALQHSFLTSVRNRELEEIIPEPIKHDIDDDVPDYKHQRVPNHEVQAVLRRLIYQELQGFKAEQLAKGRGDGEGDA
jgi:serine/threonine protein kinase